jgi:hypothetical protein
MNDAQVKVIRDYWTLITETEGKKYTLFSFGRVVMFDISLSEAMEYARYYKGVTIEEAK